MRTADPGLGDRLFAALQWLLPTRAASTLIHHLAHVRTPAIKNALIRAFMRGFGVDLAEAEHPSAEDYAHFNAFFTRALKPGARPVVTDEDALLSPADGMVGSLGRIDDGWLMQAKSHRYTLSALLAGRADLVQRFHGGDWCTIYLAPWNYHRLHMPIDGQLSETLYVPGRLFSVNASTARTVPNLFARNERVIATFDTPAGPLALVLVGAIFVGSIETVWSRRITPPHRRGGVLSLTAEGPVKLARGAEMGRFNMGSTVIVLGAPGALQFAAGLDSGSKVVVGQALGRFRTAP